MFKLLSKLWKSRTRVHADLLFDITGADLAGLEPHDGRPRHLRGFCIAEQRDAEDDPGDYPDDDGVWDGWGEF